MPVMAPSSRYARARWVRLPLCAWLFALSACSTLGQSSPDLQAAISRLSAADPNSLATLNARLAYTESLVGNATPGDCRQRLAQARAQLAAVLRSPATGVLFPTGWTRAGDAQYRIHRLTAGCSQDADERRRESLATLAAARRAVELYRDARDYRSMAAMQFNVAVAEEQLGEQPAAVDALDAAIAMDREFGFRDDAEENFKYLARLQSTPMDAAQLAARMSDFPARSVTLSFAWSATDAHVFLRCARTRLVDGRVFKSEAQSELRSSVRARSDRQWTLSDQRLSVSDDAGVWPFTPSAPAVRDAVFTPTLLEFPDLEISGAGDLERVDDVNAFADRVLRQVEAAIREQVRQQGSGDALLEVGLHGARTALAPEIIEAQVTQSYSLDTAMWIGATLQQGAWYESDAQLMLPGMPSVVLKHHLRFAYTHPVSCMGDSDDRSCVELLIHATPDATALTELLGNLPRPLQYTTASDVRLVIDPHTLRPYDDETRRYWYAAIDKSLQLEAELRSWSATYPK
jgi:hypothetical protein